MAGQRQAGIVPLLQGVWIAVTSLLLLGEILPAGLGVLQGHGAGSTPVGST